MSQKVLEVRNLRKKFKTDFWKPEVLVLDDISFDVEEGDVFGLVGPNGAGKTTVIKTLMGLIQPTAGSVSIMGKDVRDPDAKRQVGYLPENAYYYDFLRTEEVIDLYGRLFGLSAKERRMKTDELLELVGLADRRGVLLKHYSKGMLQRIGIAQALVNDPKILVFDEPMSGLDPLGRKDVRDIIVRLKEKGKTICFSSHILSDIETVCERIVIIIKGKLKALGSLSELINPRIRTIDVLFAGPIKGAPLPEGLEQVVRRRSMGDQTLLILSDEKRLEDLLNWGRQSGLKLLSVVPHGESLEDIFVEKVAESR